MDQRRPRLGDIVDDYCPRERRLANHVVVAMIGDDIKQTRCTTCDAEHAYKNAKVPPKRKKADSPAALVKQVAEGLQEKPRLNGDLGAPAQAAPAVPPAPAPPSPPPTPLADTPTPVAAADAEPDEGERGVEEGPVHRQLIRATLPRLPGEEREPRPIPEFTMRAARNTRGGFRPGNTGRPAGKGGNRGRTRQAAGNFAPGVMSSWSPSNPRPRGGNQPPQGGNRPKSQPRHQGHKKSR